MTEKPKDKKLIKKLQDRYEMAMKKREERMEDERPFRERAETIFSAPRVIMTDFWCNVCKQDCSGVGFRQICVTRITLPTAWFEGACPLGHKLIRRITDKDSDPYYGHSLLVQQQRHEMADDLLTPEDPRFAEIYPEKYAELMKKQKQNGQSK